MTWQIVTQQAYSKVQGRNHDQYNCLISCSKVKKHSSGSDLLSTKHCPTIFRTMQIGFQNF